MFQNEIWNNLKVKSCVRKFHLTCWLCVRMASVDQSDFQSKQSNSVQQLLSFVKFLMCQRFSYNFENWKNWFVQLSHVQGFVTSSQKVLTVSPLSSPDTRTSFDQTWQATEACCIIVCVFYFTACCFFLRAHWTSATQTSSQCWFRVWAARSFTWRQSLELSS